MICCLDHINTLNIGESWCTHRHLDTRIIIRTHNFDQSEGDKKSKSIHISYHDVCTIRRNIRQYVSYPACNSGSHYTTRSPHEPSLLNTDRPVQKTRNGIDNTPSVTCLTLPISLIAPHAVCYARRGETAHNLCMIPQNNVFILNLFPPAVLFRLHTTLWRI